MAIKISNIKYSGLFTKMSEAQIAIRNMNKDLNPAQLESAETTEGPLLIVAGAGSGKTKTLVHRVGTLLLKGVPASNILLVTFTNQAAAEIKNRLEEMIGENGQYVAAGTFHKIIFRSILKQYSESAYLKGLGLEMTECGIMDDKESDSLVKASINQLSPADAEFIEEKELSIKFFQSIMSRERSFGRDVYDFFSSITPGSASEAENRIAANVWKKYNEQCRSMGSIDFDDILLFAEKLLKREKNIAEELSRQFRYIMLDEYQDTNHVQKNIMDSVADYHGNICAVGDEKQSIYSFRNADISIMLSFMERYRTSKTINMNQNYRSYPELINFSNAVADAMKQRLNDGQLKSERKITESPAELNRRKANSFAIVEFATEEEEAVNVAKAIMRDINAGVQGNKITVLYRNRVLKNALERQLVDRNVPYKIIGDTSFFQRAEVRDAISLIRFIFNPWDSIAGIRILNCTSMGVSADAGKKSMQQNSINIHEFLKLQSNKRLSVKKPKETEFALSATAKKVRPFLNLCKMTREALEAGDGAEFVRDIIADIWDIYLKPSLERKEKNSATGALDNKIENVQHVLKQLKNSLEKGLHIDEIIEDLSFMVENNGDMSKDEQNQVQLMTMHASKGLEFENVYLIGFDDVTTHGDDPDESEVEESRRLFYVASTRAEKKFMVSYARERFKFGEVIFPNKSPFIVEVEERLNVNTIVFESKKEISEEQEMSMG